MRKPSLARAIAICRQNPDERTVAMTDFVIDALLIALYALAVLGFVLFW